MTLPEPPPPCPPTREAIDAEAWKVAQLAAILAGGRWHMERGDYLPLIIGSARDLLAEARRQVDEARG